MSLLNIKHKSKTLVVYYSYRGSTKFIAKIIADHLNADLKEIQVINENKFPRFIKIFFGGYQVISKKKPHIRDMHIDREQYDTVWIGTPTWIGNFAPALRTFFRKYPIKERDIGLFCSFEGNPGDTIKKMKSRLKGNKFIGKIVLKQPLQNKEDAQERIIKRLKESVKSK